MRTETAVARRPAKRSETDVKLYRLKRTQSLPVAQSEAFEFFANPQNLCRVTPPSLRLTFLSEPPPELFAGAMLDYRIWLYGLPVHWRTIIDLWEPPARFVDIQAHGPYASWRHTHIFEPDGERRTTMRDVVEFSMPFWPFGELVYGPFVRPMLERIFDFRAGELERLLKAASDKHA